MTKKQHIADKSLKRIGLLVEKLEDKELELESMYAIAYGLGAIRYDKDKVQTSPENYMERAMVEIDELKADIDRLKGKINDAKIEALENIKKVSKSKHRTILIWHYIGLKPMSEIAHDMQRSERAVYYMRLKALEEYGGIIDGR